MNLFQTKTQKKHKNLIKKQKQRALKQAQPQAQDRIKYTSQYEEGLMHITGEEASKMFRLGDIEYEASPEEEQLDTVCTYAEALNTLDKNSRYQLLVLNKEVKSDVLNDFLLPYQGDGFDNYRAEINDIATKIYEKDQRNFEIQKYAIFTGKATSLEKANRLIDQTAKNYKSRFDVGEIPLDFTPLDGADRLEVMASMLRPKRAFTATYTDIALSGLNSKAFIVPNRFSFPKDKSYFRLGHLYASVLYIRQYPKYLEDCLIRELCASGHELAISIHGKPYPMAEARKMIQSKKTINNAALRKEYKANLKDGVPEDMISGEASEIKRSADELLADIKDNNQKYFSGIFSVMVVGGTQEALAQKVKDIKDIGDTYFVTFEEVYQYKEEALNTILPLGKPYLDVEMDYMRDMTTNNLATQVPFSNIELQSPTGIVYGRNQLTGGVITLDRLKDLPTPSGLIFGASGGGKGMTVKWSIIVSFLKYLKQRFIIVDPESEYLPLAKVFGWEVLDISTGTQHHINVLDLVDSRLLDQEDKNVDLIKEKANLLSSLFESLLKNYNDEEAGLVDRVTRLTYQRFEDETRMPTLVDWYEVLKEQPEDYAQRFAGKIEPYTVGSQDIFAHETNIDLNARGILFNIKNLDERMRPFAMKVILDQIWKQVVAGQNKVTTNLFFDELQLNFDTKDNAAWFTKLWSRVRKYGTVTTGITQNISVLLSSEEGRRMISNSDFITLLRQKPVDLQDLNAIVKIKPTLLKYVSEKAPQGSGLIYAGGTIVPFENFIPKATELFEIMNTDAEDMYDTLN
ncbi:VirB4-like conjugal transfer ATPase, CD1110 family [Lactococcus petauri]|uniref:VirB4-like conjugal transfer ATPase, CD1110 family n=1 Tax=Lactococcus petauri TaxID=1940789 RepID=UPI001F599644|nr:TraC-F-type conjugal transfer protein [Lactococcus petauri]